LKKFVLILCLLAARHFVMAQSVAGITSKTDTSFTTYSAYIKAVKTHPDIKIANELTLSGILQTNDIIYCTSGKRALKLDAFYPEQNDSVLHAAIIIIHGGGWRSGNRMQHYPLAYQLAGLGYTCFTPEYRLSTEALFPAGIQDIKAAIRWVKTNASIYNIDTTKIVVAGFSAGGEMAAFIGVTANTGLFDEQYCNAGVSAAVNAVIDIDGTLSFVHPESGEGNDSKKVSAATYWFGYSKKENFKLWGDASPLKWVGKQTPPTLFINSSEKRMHAGREDYIKVLNGYSIYNEVHEFDNTPHTFCLFHPWFQPTLSYIDAFLKKVFRR
jgi:acetyl esterase/lipase